MVWHLWTPLCHLSFRTPPLSPRWLQNWWQGRGRHLLPPPLSSQAPRLVQLRHCKLGWTLGLHCQLQRRVPCRLLGPPRCPLSLHGWSPAQSLPNNPTEPLPLLLTSNPWMLVPLLLSCVDPVTQLLFCGPVVLQLLSMSATPVPPLFHVDPVTPPHFDVQVTPPPCDDPVTPPPYDDPVTPPPYDDPASRRQRRHLCPPHLSLSHRLLAPMASSCLGCC
jgi:hypothetical protein